MSVVIISARVHADNAEAVAGEARRTLAAIAAAGPDVGGAIYRLEDGVTFVAVLDLPGERDPLSALPAFVDFQQSLTAWAVEPPTAGRGETVGLHGLLGRG